MKNYTILLFVMVVVGCYRSPDSYNFDPPCDCRNDCWSTVGATGSVDEAALGTIRLGSIPKLPDEAGDGSGQAMDATSYEGMSAFLQPSAKPGKYVIRYQVSPLGGFITKLKNAKFKMDIGYKLPDTSLYSLRIYLKEYKTDTLIMSQSARTIAVWTASLTVGESYRSETVTTFKNSSIFLKYGYCYYIEAVFERKDKSIPPEINPTFRILGPSISAISICEDINPY
ncbi:MAG: hypothetical protein IPL92_13700 [Saprospiraceae bacterium]|nr:hypothetical protein [Candidatus Opimibacter iunctus]